ncbi:MAG: YcxB family protein [Hyphomicrobium sp.]
MQPRHLTYKLEPADVAVYQRAVKTRMNRISGQQTSSKATALVLTLLVLPLFLAAAHVLIPAFGLGPNNMVSFAVGLAAGVTIILGSLWAQYFAQSKRGVRPGGPVLAERQLEVSEDGIKSSSPGLSNQMAWSRFEDVTEFDGYVILWFEPASGNIIPPRAFGCERERAEFIVACKAHIVRETG